MAILVRVSTSKQETDRQIEVNVAELLAKHADVVRLLRKGSERPERGEDRWQRREHGATG